ncbi:uncharacterized protein NECHADRAFT_82303 [Fusarium vanettenii 77-13-4]|uniref:Uncharacterized protein n=1 Tax=Fusarium vanettenii (strain ATCC MYA-4622 / CBS 123669 / FGSC 9596 / NRRL 45880 / 77-13-4) TaxID=660122 RepID=C7ZQ46_FUSV7|nr:uncharacterized protein NECHADRAFT_82303 [Fusarium vanettenii 77-13-4]EEU33873.1 predicted protein [Fusarium vanettenii 77-13-4]
MEHSTSPAQEGSEANNTILLPIFNLIIPSRSNSPLQLDACYFESAGLLDESCTQEQSDCGLNWPSDPGFQDYEPPLASPQPIWWQDSPPVLRKSESLEEQLTRALCQHAHKESKGFLPLEKLHELVVEDSVAEALTTYIPGLSLDDARSHAQEICPRSMRAPLQPSFRRMFAILVMIQQPQEILTFIRHNIADHDLPLVRVRHGNKGAHELRRKTQPHKTLECLKGWSPFLVNSFEEYQWKTSARRRRLRRRGWNRPVESICFGSTLFQTTDAPGAYLTSETMPRLKPTFAPSRPQVPQRRNTVPRAD